MTSRIWLRASLPFLGLSIVSAGCADGFPNWLDLRDGLGHGPDGDPATPGVACIDAGDAAIIHNGCARDRERFTGELEAVDQYPVLKGSISWPLTVDQHLVVADNAQHIDFGDGVGLQTPASYVAKLDRSGTGDWIRRFTMGSSSSFPVPSGLTADRRGNLALTLRFQDVLEFGGSVIARTPSPSELAFAVVSLDARGRLRWVSTPYPQTTLSAFDPHGNLMSATGATLVKQSPGGAVLWERPLAVTSSPEAFMRPVSVSTDRDGNVLLTAEYNGAFEVAGDPLATNGSWGSLTAKYSPFGAPLWHRSVPGGSSLTGMVADGNSDVIVIGRSYGPIDLGTGPFGLPAEVRLVLAKYTPQGVPIFVESWAAPSWHVLQQADIDPWNNIAVTVQVDSTVDFGGGPMALNGVGLSGEGSQLAIAVAKFDPCGKHLWSHLIDDGAGDMGGSIWTMGLAVDKKGATWVTTMFHTAAQVAGRTLTASPQYGADALLIRFGL